MNKEHEVRHQDWKTRLLSWLPTVGEFIVLVIVAVILLLPASITPSLVPAGTPSADLMVSEWPTALLIQRSFAQGHGLPLWNPYYAGGQPLIADPLAALFYPPTHLVHFFSLRNYYFILILGHFIFAGIGVLLVARRVLKLPHIPSLVAAISFMATPRLISHLGGGHITIFQTVAWFPWLVLACCATARSPRRNGAFLGICIGMTLLAGHPQMAYYALIMITGLSAWLLLQRWRKEGQRAFLASTAGLALAALVGALLAAIQLLPIAEFTAVSTRQLAIKSGDTYPLPDFLSALFGYEKYFKFPWEIIITPGRAVLALALFAIATRWRKAWPLALAIVLVAGLAMGNSSFVYIFIAKILPDLGLFRGPARIWFVALLPIALLAGLGTHSLLSYLQRLLSHLSSSRFPSSRIPSYLTLGTGLLLTFAVALTLIMHDVGYARPYNVKAATTPNLLALKAAKFAGSGRIYNMQGNQPQVNSVELQTPFANGWNPLLIQSYVNYMQYAGDYTIQGYQGGVPANQFPSDQPNARLLGLIHVSVVVSKHPLKDPHLVLVGKADGSLIYKNTDDAGPGYLVQPDQNGNPPSLQDLQRLNVTVYAVSPDPDQTTFTFSTTTSAYFVLPMPTFPGWVATLNGQQVATREIGAGMLPAIKVGPGTYTLSYTYAPSSLRKGALLSAIALIAILGWLIIGLRRKPDQPIDTIETNELVAVTDEKGPASTSVHPI
jgi:hypothetical protein